MRRISAVCLALALWSGVLALFSTPASAVPTYARRYGITCSVCHTTWGALNANGVTFRLSGYRRINGVEFPPVEKDTTAGEMLSIPSTIPASIIATVGFDYRRDHRKASDGTSSTQTGSSFDVDDISIFVTGPFGPHLSIFAEFPMFETRAVEFTPTGPAEANATGGSRNFSFPTEHPTFEVAKVWWNSLLPASVAPPDSLNLLFGITHLPLGYASGKVRLSVTQYLVYERRALELLSPKKLEDVFTSDELDGYFRLSEPQALLEANGMLVPFGQYTDLAKPETFWLEYHAGVTNGSNSSADLNTEKDVYARLVGRWRGQSLGVFGYYSANTYDDDFRSHGSIANAGILSGLNRRNSTTRVGPDLTLSLAPFGIRVWLENQLLYNHDSNPTGFDRGFTWWGGFSQLNWKIIQPLHAYARYDWIRGERYDDTGVGGVTKARPQEWALVGGLQYLLLENLKLAGEYRYRQFKNDQSTPSHQRLDENFFTLRAEVGF